MIKKYKILIILLLMVILPSISYAQFNNYNQTGPPGSNMNNPNTNTSNDNEEVTKKVPSYTLKRYFKALGHKDSVNITRLFYGSVLLPGTAQIYNRDYWKLPIVYGSIGGCIGGAIYNNVQYKSTGKESYKNARGMFIAGAIFSYWAQIMDGVVSYKSDVRPLPARASLLSALCPGLGQAYNGDYWKIPVFYAGFTISGYCWAFNHKQYKRYKNLYNQAATPDGGYTGHLRVDDLKWYRDSFRRLRDYSIIATSLIYVLNIIDANVFAHFNNFDVSDDISFNVSPGIIEPIAIPKITDGYNTFANNTTYPQTFGLKMNLKF